MYMMVVAAAEVVFLVHCIENRSKKEDRVLYLFSNVVV
jgi:hypothetical protein